MFEQVLFWLLGIGAVASAAMVVTPPVNRKPVHAALALVVSFFFMAGLYAVLLAHMMAVIQILVYAGAIMVLFLFVIMLLNLSDEELGKQTTTVAQWIGGAAFAFIAATVVLAISDSADAIPPGGPASAEAISGEGFGTVQQVGDLLFRHYLVPFELTAVLLLIAVIGAVVLAKRTL